MSNDKRSVTTDALETLGTIISENEKRDAIHLAVEPVIAGHDLKPGDHIKLVDGKAVKAMPTRGLGIVDPFIDGVVTKGERFCLVVYPRKITSLRHVWTHPAFAEAEVSQTGPDKAVSEQWLRDFIANADCPDYDTVMYIITDGESGKMDKEDWVNGQVDDDYLYFSGADAHGPIPPEFWVHAEIVTGMKFHSKPDHFSCSC